MPTPAKVKVSSGRLQLSLSSAIVQVDLSGSTGDCLLSLPHVSEGPMAVGLTVLKGQLCTLGEVDEVEVGEEGTASIHGRLGGVDPQISRPLSASKNRFLPSPLPRSKIGLKG